MYLFLVSTYILDKCVFNFKMEFEILFGCFEQLWGRKEIVGKSLLCRTCPMTSMKSSLVHAWHGVGMANLHAGQTA